LINAERIAKEMAQEISLALDRSVNVQDFRTRNLVYRAIRTPFKRTPIRLDTLQTLGAGMHGGSYRFQYDPELFPGMHISSRIDGVCILVFTSGKLVITGLKDERSLAKHVDIVGGLVMLYDGQTRLLS
jgi:TATA-box binding protein (TBP) (component of TFIID and TFIIIB)